MYKLYWSEGTAAFGPQVVLEEADLDYQIIEIDLAAGENNAADYLAINPVGKVPALVLPDGQILYEAAAIMLYLAEHHRLDDLAPPADHPLRGLFLRSLFYLTNTVQNDYKQFYYPERYSTDPADGPRIKAKSVENLIANWRPVNDHLGANGPYHLAARFSLADIYVAMLATWFTPMGDLFETFPAIRRCYGLVSQRPAVRRCLERQHGISVGGSVGGE